MIYVESPEIQDIRNQGYTNIEHGLTDGDVALNFEQFEAVRETIMHDDPRGILRKSFAYTADDIGTSVYFWKDSIAGQINPEEPERGLALETKTVYHFGPKTPDHVRLLAGKYLPKHFEQFLDTSEEAYYIALRAHRIGARILGLENIFHTHRNDPDMDRFHLRYLIYDPSSDTPDSKGRHFDRSGTTFAIAESSPGLHGTTGHNGYRKPLSPEEYQAMSARMLLSPIAHHEGIGKFFLGAGFERLRDLDATIEELPLLLHGVAKMALARPDLEVVWRKALILFGNPHAGIENYTPPTKHETKINFDLAA